MQEKKIKLIALFGAGGSGKTALLNYIHENCGGMYHKVISYTTREPRKNEIQGYDYIFTDTKNFGEMVLLGDMIEATSWGGEFYGTAFSDLDPNKINIKILDPEGIECLSGDSRIELIPIYIACEGKTCLKRMLDREKNPDTSKICKRHLEDLDRFNKEFDFAFDSYYNGEGMELDWFPGYLKSRLNLTKAD